MLQAFDSDDIDSLDYILMSKPSMLDRLEKYQAMYNSLNDLEKSVDIDNFDNFSQVEILNFDNTEEPLAMPNMFSDLNLLEAFRKYSNGNNKIKNLLKVEQPTNTLATATKTIDNTAKTIGNLLDRTTQQVPNIDMPEINNTPSKEIRTVPKGLNNDTLAFFKAFSEYAERLGYPVKIAPEGGFRTAEMQHKIYMRNKPGHWVTGKDGYKSKSIHQSGLALDIISKKGYGYPKINAKIAQLLRKFATENKDKWSFRFIAKDPNHVEINREKYGLGKGTGIFKNGYIEYYRKRKKKRKRYSRR